MAVAAAFGATFLPEPTGPYLGLLSLTLGLKAAWQVWKHRGDEEDGPARAGRLYRGRRVRSLTRRCRSALDGAEDADGAAAHGEALPDAVPRGVRQTDREVRSRTGGFDRPAASRGSAAGCGRDAGCQVARLPGLTVRRNVDPPSARGQEPGPRRAHRRNRLRSWR